MRVIGDFGHVGLAVKETDTCHRQSDSSSLSL